MKRRHFIKISASSLCSLLATKCISGGKRREYDYSIQSDIHEGHLLFNDIHYPVHIEKKTDYLIVGGGLAGLSAAYALGDKDYYLCELSNGPGGTSSARTYYDHTFAQGAHYDLSYPDNFGTEVLKMLENINVIRYDPLKNRWNFKEKEYLIPASREILCMEHDEMREGIHKNDDETIKFFKSVLPYTGQMPLPTRLINTNFHYLNHMSFLNFIKSQMNPSQQLIRRIDYQMMDDYGGRACQVSALAGIHYYTCRPYFHEELELFSPPEGNYYFVSKILQKVNQEHVLLNHLVKSIIPEKNDYIVNVLDLANENIIKFRTKNIIYAGQKNGLKFVYPPSFKLFEENIYSPWIILNYVLKDDFEFISYWQNEILYSLEGFMGFVDSGAQFTKNKTRVLTIYFCLPVIDRYKLLKPEDHIISFIDKITHEINRYYGIDIYPSIVKVFVKVLGHAMPIPSPGYLFNDRNKHGGRGGIIFAGVDNGRLPLLFEAIDSGLSAMEYV